MNRFIILLCAVLLIACSSANKNRKQIVGPTLGEIPALPAAIQNSELEEEVTLDTVEQYYQRALDAANDQGTRRTILIRLADILMLRSEEQMLNSEAPGNYFGDAIARYRELINLQKQAIAEGGNEEEYSKELDQMLYQLSKAYALSGQTESAGQGLEELAVNFEDSSYSPEAKFRRAEQAFSDGDYEKAESLYSEVIQQGTFTPFYQNAIYMYGWSQFKRSRYEKAIAAFTKVLDHLYGDRAPIKIIPKSQQNLVEDTLRVMSLSFSYLEGPQTVSEVFANDTQRPYIDKVYQALGKLYFGNERYRDSASAYRQYVLDFPLSDQAPLFSGYIIEVYDSGDFPSLLIPAKEDYVINYGIDSEYWQSKTQKVRDALSINLKVYLEELAKYEHANGQRSIQVESSQRKKVSAEVLQTQRRNAFLKAAQWYDQYIRTFPKDDKTPDMLFLMAEALTEAGELSRAYDAYKRLAYDVDLPPEKQARGAEAGYSALLMAQRILKTNLDENQRQIWQERIITQSLAFADKYAQDKRAVGVLNSAAETLLSAGRQPEAINAAKRVTEWQPPADKQLQRSAWLVMGQSEFDLQNFSGSDVAYGQALQLTAVNDASRRSIVERQAASIYKNAESLLKQEGQQQAAVNQLLRVQEVAPDTDIAITAQYDAGNELMAMKRWSQAERVFSTFRQRYPNSKLYNSIYAKMVVIYQELEQWVKAGNELTAMSTVSDDPVMRQQSLLLAAELYEKSGQINKSISSYQAYIKRYPQPLDDYVESMNKLAVIYQQRKDIRSYEYWLQQMMRAHDTAGVSKTERSLYLAANAQAHFARKDYQGFANIPLTLPLQTSLARKKQALGITVKSYERLIAYGVAEFVTEAKYYLGEVYVRLSQDLMKSERPKGLSALAKDQYDLLLEDQVYPFEDKAIELHKSNIALVKKELYDNWVKRSYQSLAKLSPGQFNKPENKEWIRELY